MSEKKVIKPVALAVGAALAGTFAISGAVNADTVDNPFSMSTLSAGYMLGAVEGACGEDKKGEGSCGEGSCGEDKKGEGACGEGSCGEEKKGEGTCGEKDAEGACGEGSCGADTEEKGAEGSCGEGSCGADKE
jgi:uncharacterized low-complexity protein